MTALVLAAILTLAPALPAATAERYAADIALAAGDDLEIAVALVVTAAAESDFRETIERCACKRWECDPDKNGKPRAYGLFQLQFYWWDGHSPDEICASNTLSTDLAGRELRIHRAMVGGSMRKAIRRHVGRLPATDRRVKDRPKNYDRLYANARKALVES